MLPRLKKRRDFLRAASHGTKSVRPGLILQVRPYRQGETAAGGATDSIRVGFTVSRKVGNAVTRNRARRRLREAAELVLGEGALRGRDYVLIGRRETISRPFDALVRDLEEALRHTGAAARSDIAGDGGAKDGTKRA